MIIILPLSIENYNLNIDDKYTDNKLKKMKKNIHTSLENVKLFCSLINDSFIDLIYMNIFKKYNNKLIILNKENNNITIDNILFNINFPSEYVILNNKYNFINSRQSILNISSNLHFYNYCIMNKYNNSIDFYQLDKQLIKNKKDININNILPFENIHLNSKFDIIKKKIKKYDLIHLDLTYNSIKKLISKHFNIEITYIILESLLKLNKKGNIILILSNIFSKLEQDLIFILSCSFEQIIIEESQLEFGFTSIIICKNFDINLLKFHNFNIELILNKIITKKVIHKLFDINDDDFISDMEYIMMNKLQIVNEFHTNIQKYNYL